MLGSADGSLGVFYWSRCEEEKRMSVFAKRNLQAWCIVPFDACNRGPRDRAQMLQRLGVGMLAYDWREEHIPSFDEELRQLREHGIELTAFWLSGGTPGEAGDVRKDPQLRAVLEFIERNSLHIQVWKTFGGRNLHDIADPGERLDTGARQVRVLARAFGNLGCRYGLYNHGGWGGEPGVMVEIAKRAADQNVGIVYNFHHGHEHLSQMPGAFTAMVPYLMCVNLNGMVAGGPKIVPLGEGEDDAGILRMVGDSAYRGPIGILDHRSECDAEESLRQNLEGMVTLLEALGDGEAASTYRE